MGEDTCTTVVTPSDSDNEKTDKLQKESGNIDSRKDDDPDDALAQTVSYESTNELESGNSQSSDKENPKEEDISSCSYVKVNRGSDAEDHKHSSPTVCNIPTKEAIVPSKQSIPSQMGKKKQKNPHEHIHALNLNFLDFN